MGLFNWEWVAIRGLHRLTNIKHNFLDTSVMSKRVHHIHLLDLESVNRCSLECST